MKFCVLRFEKIKSIGELTGRSRHNRRKGVVPDHVDLSKVSLNLSSGDAVKKFGEITKGKVMRKNGVLAVEGVLSFSPEMKGKIDTAAWGRDSIAWLEKEFGAENILELDLHEDEKTPHLHVIFVPRDKKGKWNWRGVCEGKQGLRDLQSRYAEVMEPFGLVRGEPKIGRDHVPPAVKRELDKFKEAAKTAGMKKEEEILGLVKSFFGEAKFLDFLKWAKARAKKAAEMKKLEADLRAPEI